MFPIDPSDELMSAILRIVSQQPGLSVGDVHAALKSKRKAVTLQHLYRKVNQLVDAHILLKRKGALTLNLLWLSYLEYFASEAKSAIGKNTALSVFPLKKGQRLSFSADTMNAVQTLWHHLLTQLHRTAPQKKLAKYYSHAWWVWNKHTLDIAFYKKIYDSGVHCLWLYGANTPLDRAAVTMHPDLLDSRIALDAPFPSEGYNLNVYGDYIFECVFPKNISKHLELVFQSTKTTNLEELAVIDNLFDMQADFTITVWNNPTLAARMRKQIERYFLFGARIMPEEGETRK